MIGVLISIRVLDSMRPVTAECRFDFWELMP